MIPWWGWLLIVFGALGAGGIIGGAAMLLYVGKGLWQ